MSFFKKLKKKVSNQVLTMAEQPRRLPPIPPRSEFNPFRDPSREERRPMPTPVNPNIQSVRDFVDNLRAQNILEDIETGALPPAGMSMPVAPSEAGLRPRDRFKIDRGRKRLPRFLRDRMPSGRPTPRFFGGGLGSILERIFGQLEREDELRRLPFREDMPMERFPMMRPQFAAGEEVDMNIMKQQFLRKKMLESRDDFRRQSDMRRMGVPSAFIDPPDRDRMIADQAAREGISPAEQRMMMIQKTAADMGRTISDTDAQLFGMGEISFEEAMSRAMPMVDMDQVAMERNLMQQEQLGFAAGDEVDVAALPKGLKAMYDSGPKGREGVEKIAAKTDKFAEGGAVESEIDKALEEIQGAAPDAMVIQQVMTMVMEMIQSGASEEQIVAALKEMGLDDEDIQQVMMMVAEEMAGQDSIDGQLAQMM